MFKLIHILKSFLNIIELSSVIFKNKISGYPSFVNKFENDFTRFINAKYGVIFSNGTSSM